MHSLCILYAKLRAIEIYLNYPADHLLLLLIKLFKKTKRVLELVSLPHFVHDFWRKIFSYYILLTDQISLSGCFCFVKYWAIYGLDVINFEINLIFPINPSFLHDQKVKTKIWISWEWKELLRWNKKHCSPFLKRFHWSK